MDYRGTEKDALQMLIKHELAIADLYAAYAERYPDHRDYRLLLSSEEKDHADAIRNVLEVADQNQSGLKTSGFKPAAVNTSIAYLEDLTKAAQTTPVPIGDALSSALDLEKAMIERKFFDIFDTPSPVAQETLMILTQGTEKHVATIEHEWQKYRKL